MTSIKITCAYNNKARERFRAGHGQAIVVKCEKSQKRILFDAGKEGKDLLHNLRLLQISPNDFDAIVLSHGHYDHTGGLLDILYKRSNRVIPIYLHPDALKPKVKVKSGEKSRDIGFPKLPRKLTNYSFIFTRELHPITEHIIVSGEIKQRTAKESGASHLHIKSDSTQPSKKDPFKDDQSLFVVGSHEAIILCGCCHAGLINVIRSFKSQFNDKKLKAIIGGTHMMEYSHQELDEVIASLDSSEIPLLYLNHCSGNKSIQYLQEKLGDDIVKPFFVGDRLDFSLK